MYCISMKNSHLEKIKKLNYIHVGLGIENLTKNGLQTIQVKTFLLKINFMVRTLFTIGFGKIN